MKDSNTKSNSVLIAGCGDLGIRTGTALAALGWQVHGVRRNCSLLPAQFTAHQADYTVPGALEFLPDLRPDLVLATFNPSARSVAGYRRGFTASAANLLAALGEHRPGRILFVSSTRVFAESSGGWVDEHSALSADDERALAIIEAERILLDSPHPVSVVRFGGIYGSPGGRLLSRIARGELCDPEPGRWSNRIHREDCAGFLAQLLCSASAGEDLEPVYIGVDDQPALQYEVEVWLARELGVTAGGPVTAASAEAATGKRCGNRLLHASGYRLRFPDYRSGYREVIAGADAARVVKR